MDPSRVFTQRQARMEAADSADRLSLPLQSRHPIFRHSTNSSRPPAATRKSDATGPRRSGMCVCDSCWASSLTHPRHVPDRHYHSESLHDEFGG